MESTMKSFKEVREAAAAPGKKVTYNQARKWVFHRLENTDHTHDRMKKDFHKEYGKHNSHHFDRAVSEYMD